MKLDAATIKAYPKFNYYMTNDIPKLANNQKIVGSIKKFAGATSKGTIQEALRWGSNPQIKLTKSLICAGAVAIGCYKWGSDILEIEEQLVIDFEAGKGARRLVAGGGYVYLLGVTVLHELTHWADAQDGVDDIVPGDPSNEEGNAFEKAVYGSVIV